MLIVQAITFRSESEMLSAASKLPLGSLAFIVPDELLFLRIQQGLRQVQVKHRYFLLLLTLSSVFRHVTSTLRVVEKTQIWGGAAG